MRNTLNHQYAITPAPVTIGDLVSDQGCLCVSDDCPVTTLLAMMRQMDTRTGAVVGHGGIFQGLVTTSAARGAAMMDSPALRAGDIMIRTSHFLPSELDIADALDIMRECDHVTLPVLDDNARLVGIAHRDVLQSHRDNGPGYIMIDRPLAGFTSAAHAA